jgi:hypothetical protein
MKSDFNKQRKARRAADRVPPCKPAIRSLRDLGELRQPGRHPGEAQANRLILGPRTEGAHTGFRLAVIPEPGSGLLVQIGMLGLARGRRPSMWTLLSTPIVDSWR